MHTESLEKQILRQRKCHCAIRRPLRVVGPDLALRYSTTFQLLLIEWFLWSKGTQVVPCRVPSFGALVRQGDRVRQEVLKFIPVVNPPLGDEI